MEHDDDMLQVRSYQAQLEDIAKKKNTIIHLPTGSGKTYIAIRLIKHLRGSLALPWGEGGKRTFFLVNTVPLVEQQKNVIEKLCPVVGVAGFSSEDQVDYWDEAKWNEELSKHQVIVMTCQILSDMITHSYIRIEDINLLIFDECHHAVDDHPMRLVMKQFEDCPVEKQPRVLGLTATLLNSNVALNKVEQTLKVLETTFHATIATVDGLDEVLSYSTNPRESMQFHRAPAPTAASTEAKRLLTDLMQLVLVVQLPTVAGDAAVKLQLNQQDITTDPNKIVKAVKNMIVDMCALIDDLGVYGGSMGILAYTVQLMRLKKRTSTKEEATLYSMAITGCTCARDILEEYMENDHGYEKIVKHSSQQLLHLYQLLKEYSPNVMKKPGVCLKYNQERQPLSGLIFTKQRFTAKILYNILKEVKETNPEEFGFLSHDFIVGFNVSPFKTTREQYYVQKASKLALMRFCNRELNCLIATNVIEEGIDIPQCLLVLRFDPPLEYRSYIQSKGRARSPIANYVMFIKQENKEKFHKQYQTFQQIEKMVQGLLLGNTSDRAQPSQGEIQAGLYEEDDIEPYITKTGARLMAVKAISLLNRYCTSLPHDQFTTIRPSWISERILDKKSGNYRHKILITLPLTCPVTEVIQGKPYFNTKLAKRSAALLACARLHQAGELDVVTLLPKRYGAVDFDDTQLRPCFPNWPWDAPEPEDAPQPGTKKRKRKHDKVFPKCLQPSPDQGAYYLHIIRLNATFEKPKEPREAALYEMLLMDEGFGILTPRPLPQLCEFPMFLTVGEVTTSIEINYASVLLDDTQFELIKSFHLFLFDQVLAIAKQFLVYDGAENCMFAVPLAESGVDWRVMETHRDIRAVAAPSYEERRDLNVTVEGYKHHVVTPWYRSTVLPDRYIVSNVLEYIGPSSMMTNGTETFEDYYMSKYNLQIVGQKYQPLLEVRNISTRMNCLLRRSVQTQGLTEKQKKQIAAVEGDNKPNGYEELFIPEYCIKYDFPGVLWYKAMMLPSVFHRVFMLLIADELRRQIATEGKIGQVSLNKGQSWKPIKNDPLKELASHISQIEPPREIHTIDRLNPPVSDAAKNVLSMKDAVLKLKQKKLSKEYPWEEEMEPLDIERNLTTVTGMEVECYVEFVSAEMASVRSPAAPASPAHAPASPAHAPASPRRAARAALTAPPVKYNDALAVLSPPTSTLGPELKDILAALTTGKCNDGFDLERAETLGDSFLKFASTLYLFHKFPALNEGQLTNIKGRLLGNRNLYYAGARINLGGRMKVEQFSPRKDFLLPGFSAPPELTQFMEENQLRPTFLFGRTLSRAEARAGRVAAASLAACRALAADADPEPPYAPEPDMQMYVGKQVVADKTVADCVEALIGTYLLSGGVRDAVRLMEWLRVLPAEDNFVSYLNKGVKTAMNEGRATLADIDYLMGHSRRDIEKIIGYTFNDPSLLLEAFSHPSFINNRVTRSYERLEFLGDALLDFLVTAHVFENSPRLKPGALTDLRSALVNNVTFASFVVRLGLHKFLCSDMSPALDAAVLSFVEHQQQRRHSLIEDVLTLIDEDECRVADYVEVPKVLSDLFESLAGAIYLDNGGDLAAVWRVFYAVMWREIAEFTDNIPKQPVRLLYENVHACPEFGASRMTDSAVPRVMVPATVSHRGKRITVHGFGANKFQAKRAAAKMALKVLAL